MFMLFAMPCGEARVVLRGIYLFLPAGQSPSCSFCQTQCTAVVFKLAAALPLARDVLPTSTASRLTCMTQSCVLIICCPYVMQCHGNCCADTTGDDRGSCTNSGCPNNAMGANSAQATCVTSNIGTTDNPIVTTVNSNG